MLYKGSKWYSDWTTPDGKRHRKSHSSQLAAQRHQNKMRRESGRPQRDARSVKPSRPSSALQVINQVRAGSELDRLCSPQRPVSRSMNSERPTSRGRGRATLTSRSGRAATGTAR
jgi:hypothetical protein